MARLLIIDDDRPLVRALRIALSSRGHEISTAYNAEQGVLQTSLSNPEVVILDLGLPDADGYDVCRNIRRFSKVPILVLSAAGEENRKVSVLDAGADDYVTKPFGMAEFEARLRVLLRRTSSTISPVISSAEMDATSIQSSSAICSVGPISVDLVHHMAHVENRALNLTAREFDFLAFLARNQGRVCTHQMILREVWGIDYLRESQYLRVYAHRLRRKLGDAGSLLQTQSGIGYALVAQSVSGQGEV